MSLILSVQIEWTEMLKANLFSFLFKINFWMKMKEPFPESICSFHSLNEPNDTKKDLFIRFISLCPYYSCGVDFPIFIYMERLPVLKHIWCLIYSCVEWDIETMKYHWFNKKWMDYCKSSHKPQTNNKHGSHIHSTHS